MMAIELASRSASSTSVGYKNDRLAGLPVNTPELGLKDIARNRVEGPERLVHEQHLGVRGQRAGNPDTLLLSPGKLVRILGPIVLRIEPQQLQQFGDAIPHPLSRPPQQAWHGRDVILDRPVRKQTDGLNRVADPPLKPLDRHTHDVFATDPD